MKISPLAGKPAPPEILINVPKLVAAYYSGAPDPAVPAQRVAFGTSGHRGSSLDLAFNESHILAITEAICLHRAQQGIDGPLYLGIDTHALSVPASCDRAGRGVASNAWPSGTKSSGNSTRLETGASPSSATLKTAPCPLSSSPIVPPEQLQG